MKKLVALMIIAVPAGLCQIAYAGNPDNQTSNVAVSAVNGISVSGNPGDITVAGVLGTTTFCGHPDTGF